MDGSGPQSRSPKAAGLPRATADDSGVKLCYPVFDSRLEHKFNAVVSSQEYKNNVIISGEPINGQVPAIQTINHTTQGLLTTSYQARFAVHTENAELDDRSIKIRIVIKWWNLHYKSLLESYVDRDLDPDQRITALNGYVEKTLCPWATQHPDPAMANLIIQTIRITVSYYIAQTIWYYQQFEILKAYLECIRLENGRDRWKTLLDQECASYEELYAGYVVRQFKSLIKERVEVYHGRQPELAIYLQLTSSQRTEPLNVHLRSPTCTSSSSISRLQRLPLSPNVPIVSAFDPTILTTRNTIDDSLRSIADHMYSEPWVQPINFRHYKTLLVQAGLGRGKSLASKLFIQNNPTPRVLVMSPRQTFAANIQGEFNRETQIQLNGLITQLRNLGFINYLDHMKTPNWEQYPRLIISPESLHRLFAGYQPYDLIIIDESESVLKQFSSPTTMTHNTAMCAYMFTQILKEAENVVMLDAFLGNRTYNIAKSLRGHVRIEINTHPPIPRKYREYADSNRLFEVFFELLQQGWKIYFYCASKKKALELRSKLELYYLDKKGLIYTSETSGPDRRALKGVRELWGDPKLDYVITTSTNTVGINFDVGPDDPQGLRPFDFLFAYFSANGPVPRDGFQNLMRPRHLTQNFLHLYINDQYRGHKDYGATPHEVKSRIQRRESLIDQIVEQLRIDMRWNETENWYQNLHVANLVEDGRSHRFQRSIVHRYLKICGYTSDDDGHDEQECEDRLDDVPAAPYESIPEIDDSHARILMDLVKMSEITKEELQILDKYFFKKKFNPQTPIDRLKNLYISHWQNLSGKKHLYNLYDEKNYTPEEILQRDAKKCSRIKIRCGIKAEQRELIGILNQILRITDSSAKAEIPYEFLVSITPQILDLRAKLGNAFETRGSSKPDRLNSNTQAAHLINEVYRIWCNNCLKKTLKIDGKPFKKKINGVTTDISSYHLIGAMDATVLEDQRLWNLIRKVPSSSLLDRTLRKIM